MQQDNYGSVSKFFHWTIALLIILNYILGLTLDDTSWYDFHKQTGLTILVLVILRLIWRLISHYPKELAELPQWERHCAVAAQVLLYVLLLGIPLGGILLVQSAGYSLHLWGIIPIPTLISEKPHAVSHFIKECHEWGAHAIITLASLHALIALKHHFINKNRVLLRMLPFARDK